METGTERLVLVWPFQLMDDLPLGIERRGSVSQLFRYAIVGITINFAGYIVYLLITYLGGTPKITMTILYGAGVVTGFFGNRKLTFSHEGGLIETGVRYFIAHCLGYLINLIILFLFVDKLGYAHQLVQAVAILVVAGFLFPMFKYFVFREPGILDTDR